LDLESRTSSRILRALLLLASLPVAVGCSTIKKIFDTSSNSEGPSRPIANPFGAEMSAAQNPSDPRFGGNMILRTRKGDRSIEVELPSKDQGMTDFVIPVSPHFQTDGGKSPASGSADGMIDERYRERGLSYTDREIISNMPQGLPEDADKRREIEQSLGLMASDDTTPDAAASTSYLANIDRIKQLYRLGRYEAALLEIDEMLRVYHTDPKLYAMRGTCLDRLGKTELAMKSWNQSLRFDPSNQSLRRFIERRQQKRSLAGQ
jgi:hypothetical protein